MLVTDPPPDAGGGGAVILRSLIGVGDYEKIVWATLTPPQSPVVARTVVLDRPTARVPYVFDGLVHAKRLAAEVSDLARVVAARGIWIVMHGTAVHIAARLARRAQHPLHFTVHDDPPYANALRSRRHCVLVPWIARDVSAALRGARSVDVISQSLARRYRRYGIADLRVVHRAVAGPVAAASRLEGSMGPPSVGVLGSTYGAGQFSVLGKAIALAAHRIGARGRLLVIGGTNAGQIRHCVGSAVDVECTGHLEEHAALLRLRECSALYLSYPFGWRDRVLRQTSFPTKLSTYVLAARPLLVHAPRDSSIAPLCSAHPRYAMPWCSMNALDGADALGRLLAADTDVPTWHLDADRVREHFYAPERNRTALFSMLNALPSS